MEATREGIAQGMRKLVAESLALDVADVTLQSRLTADLGADSLDFVDMIFLIEKRFGVKIRESELDFLSRLDFSSPAVMKEGRLTAETVARLAEWLPALRSTGPEAKVTPQQLFSMITVETLCILVERKRG